MIFSFRAKEQPHQQDGFLAVIDRKIAALQALADSYRAALSLGAIGQPGEIEVAALGGSGGGRVDAPIDLPRGALLGKSLPAAVKLWLQSVRRKQTVKEIATALRDGGVESTSDNFEQSLRTNLEKGSKAPKASPARPRGTKKAVKGRTSAKAHRKASGDENKVEAILFALPLDNAAAISPNEIVATLKARGVETTPDYVRLTLRRLLARGKAQKVDGKYCRPGRSSAA